MAQALNVCISMDAIKKAALSGARDAVWLVFEDALIRAGGNRDRAREHLGLSNIRAFHRAIEKYDLRERVRHLDRANGWNDYWPGVPRAANCHSEEN